MALRQFYKMTGSGNDFVVFDARDAAEAATGLDAPGVVGALCARGTGVGADGVVLLMAPAGGDADFRMRYYNSDGSRAELCGNAALCVTRLAVELGAGQVSGMRFETDSGVLTARVAGGLPEVDLQPVRLVRSDAPGVDLEGGEHRIGYAVAGVPHLVVRCADAERADVVGRGGALRRHRTLERGANVNFVSPRADGAWTIRTYERGVEAETLACGTGAIATAVLLASWGESGAESTLVTRSGRLVTVRLRRVGDEWWPTLRGEGRIVFTGELASD